MDSLKEISQFLDLSARLDLKAVALQHLMGLSASVDGVTLLSKCEEVLKKITLLTMDTAQTIKKDALLCLVNISAEEIGAVALMLLENKSHNDEVSNFTNVVTILVKSLLDPLNKDSDAACMALSNISRSESNVEFCATLLLPHMTEIMDAFTNVSYNKAGSKLHYIGPLLSNISGSSCIRQWLYDTDKSKGGVIRVASFCQYEGSVVRRGGAVGTIRNICFDVDKHDWLLSSEVDMLTYLLLPLAGGEELSDDEMDTLPISLQYLPQEKQREQDPDIRRLLLEALSRLCTKRHGREYLRKHGTYYILRELHKWEKDRKALLVCENVVDILIRKENEIEVEDITSVEVPEDYKEKFQKMDSDFINDP